MMPANRETGTGRFRGDDGAILVEAAFVLPVLLFIILGLVDFSMWEFQRSQASSAARDGARVGILLPLGATEGKSKAENQAETKAAIVAAVRSRIPDDSKLQAFTVNVYCEGGSKAVDFSGCDNPTPGTTRLIVETSWQYQTISPVGALFGKPTISSSAGMIYVGPRSGAGSTPPTLCEVQTLAPSVPPLNGSTLSGELTMGFTTNGAADCVGWSVTLLNQDGDAMGTGSVNAGTGLATFGPGDLSGLSPGPYVIRLATATREWMVDVTLNSPDGCVVSFHDPSVPKLSGSTMTGNLTVKFTTNGAPACSDWSASLADSNGASKGDGSVDGGAGLITFTPGQVPGLSPGSYTVRLSTPAMSWSTPIGLSPECSIIVTAVPTTNTAHNSGDLSSPVTATLAPNNACDGPFTVQLVRRTADNLFVVYQTKTASTSTATVQFSASKHDLDNNGPKKYEPGTYRVFVSGGGLPAAGVYSNDMAVSG